MLNALQASIQLLAPPFAHLVLTDVLSVVPALDVTNVSQIITEVALVLPVMMVNSLLLDQLPMLLAHPVTIQTVRLAQVMLLENVLCVRTVMLCQVENALNVMIPTVTSALVLPLEDVTLALPVIPWFLVDVLLVVMESTQLVAKTSAQPALLDAVNAIMTVPPVLLAQPITICHQVHVLTAVTANMHLLDQLTFLHASLVWMPTVSIVAQETPESALFVKKVNSPYQAFARTVEIPTVSLVLDLEKEDVLLVEPVID